MREGRVRDVPPGAVYIPPVREGVDGRAGGAAVGAALGAVVEAAIVVRGLVYGEGGLFWEEVGGVREEGGVEAEGFGAAGGVVVVWVGGGAL